MSGTAEKSNKKCNPRPHPTPSDVGGGGVRGEHFKVTKRCVELPWSKLFQAFSVKFTLIFFHECSINHSTSAHVKVMHIDANLSLLEHFEREKSKAAPRVLLAILG